MKREKKQTLKGQLTHKFALSVSNFLKSMGQSRWHVRKQESRHLCVGHGCEMWQLNPLVDVQGNKQSFSQLHHLEVQWPKSLLGMCEAVYEYRTLRKKEKQLIGSVWMIQFFSSILYWEARMWACEFSAIVMSNLAPMEWKEGSQRVWLSGKNIDDYIILYVGKLTPGILWTSIHEWKHMMSFQAKSHVWVL